MIRNFITIALRVMLRSKTYSVINILGLAMGVACCVLLTLYLYEESSYDKHHHDGENIYRVITHFHGDVVADLNELASCSPPIGPALQREIPEVVTAVRMLPGIGASRALITFGENTFYEERPYLADSTFFDVLTYSFIEGNPEKALVNPNSVVLTEPLAKKLFGNEAALNKIISISQSNTTQDYAVTGVVRSIQPSIEDPHLIISMMSTGGIAEYVRSDEAMNEWGGQNFLTTYVRLQHGSSVPEVESKMDALLFKYGEEDMKAIGFTKNLTLEPIKDIYLKSAVNQSPRIRTLYIVGSIAAFILLIACINFMNLATAKAARRAGEIGMRKVMGAARSSLIAQILGEAMVTVLLAILIALLIVQLVIPAFNGLTDKTISFSSMNIGLLAAALIAMLIVTGLLAGAYPAFFMSSFQPARVLKGKAVLSDASGLLRKVLVVFQFMIAIILVCGLIFISRQLNFMQDKDLGFTSSRKIVLPLRTPSAKKAYASLRTELLRDARIDRVSAADYLPGMSIFNDYLLYTEGSSMKNGIRVFVNSVDHDYADVMGITQLTGRKFTDNPKAETSNMLINESASKAFGYTPDEAVGKIVSMDWQGTTYRFTIIGVIKDFNQNSLRETIAPLALAPVDEGGAFDNLIVRPAGNDVEETLKSLEQTWDRVVKDTPFEYSFLDQDLQKQYLEDQRLARIITSFTLVAMFISCLGLYGLSSFMAARRFKEIGIRKVMGASVSQIVNLLSLEFAKLVTIAFVVAVPIAWYAMNEWLSGFAYRIGLDPVVFLFAGLTALGIALLTVSFESVKAAIINPVRALRSE